jgi:homoserine acetyltransferase
MDLFDMTLPALEGLGMVPPSPASDLSSSSSTSTFSSTGKKHPPMTPHPPAHLPSLASGLSPLANTPTLILGVQSDILFPVEQQRELADALRMVGNEKVRYYELGGVWGHDTFLLDVLGVGGAIRGFLS